jgi:hypothetical protein
MGIFSAIKKGLKKVLKLTGITSVLKPVKGLWDNLTGKTAAKNMAKSQEAQLKQQAEQAKLDASNEVDNVTKFDDSGGGGLDSDTRRKKRSAGAYGSGIGLVV